MFPTATQCEEGDSMSLLGTCCQDILPAAVNVTVRRNTKLLHLSRTQPTIYAPLNRRPNYSPHNYALLRIIKRKSSSAPLYSSRIPRHDSLGPEASFARRDHTRSISITHTSLDRPSNTAHPSPWRVIQKRRTRCCSASARRKPPKQA